MAHQHYSSFAGAGAGIPLRRAAEIILDMTGDTVPGEDEPRVRRAASYLDASPWELVATLESEVHLRGLRGRRVA
jgi:hypothetical protein